MKTSLVTLVVGAIVSGCASLPELADHGYTAKEQQKWEMEARVAVRASQDAWQADLVWTHDDGQDRLRLSGPLSQGLISIVVQKDLIYINEGDGHEYLAKDPDAALKARLGFSVPLKSLRFWMLGSPNPEEASIPLHEEGFVQQDWRISPSGRMSVNGRTLPERLVVEGADVRLKIIVDQWTGR